MEDEAPEPCPAAFDSLAGLLLAWSKVPTLDRWAECDPPSIRPWGGASERYGVGALVKVCTRPEDDEAEEPLPVRTWAEVRAMQQAMTGARNKE